MLVFKIVESLQSTLKIEFSEESQIRDSILVKAVVVFIKSIYFSIGFPRETKE